MNKPDNDPYTNFNHCVDRLYREWLKHPRLIIATDADDTLYDFHGNGTQYPAMADILAKCKKHNFYIVLFTASVPERYDMLVAHMEKTYGVKPDSINKNPIDLPFGNWGKIYYNHLLDDRAGLNSSIGILAGLFHRIEEHNRVRTCDVIYAPNRIDWHSPKPKIFLGGSIDMGAAEPWQDRVIAEMQGHDVTVLNPRRKDWDSSWVQDIANEKFRQQVEWELDGLQGADIVVMYFAENSKSPITMMELGLTARRNPIVYCPSGFYRKGNIDIVCKSHDIRVYEDFVGFIDALKKRA